MRIKVYPTNIIEAYNVNAVPGAVIDRDNEKYDRFSCELYIDYDNEIDRGPFGEFDCTQANSYEDIDNIIKPFFDDLYKNGYIDISTEEKRKKYRLLIY